MFLAIGNTLGMLWAYEELGWGGYWAWDPVENAAFMPLLTASAFVHSVMIQERRGLLKVWNVFLICLTFFLTIFGTFLTRSGAIASVHSFAQSSIGTYFVVVPGRARSSFAATLIFYRWPELRDLAALAPPAHGGGRDGLGRASASALPGLYVIYELPRARSACASPSWRSSRARSSSSALELVFRRMTRGLDLDAQAAARSSRSSRASSRSC